MSRDRLTRVLDMLESARLAIELAQGRTRDDVDQDAMLALALARAVEIIGEAAKHVPRSLGDRYPAVPWHAIAGTRDQLIHGYFSVDNDVLWQIVSVELLELVPQLEAIINTEGIEDEEPG